MKAAAKYRGRGTVSGNCQRSGQQRKCYPLTFYGCQELYKRQYYHEGGVPPRSFTAEEVELDDLRSRGGGAGRPARTTDRMRKTRKERKQGETTAARRAGAL